MKFNEKLIELRKQQGLSQEELGYKLDVTRQTVSKWELGQTTPEMDKLVEMSKIFNVNVDYLINESELEAKIESNPNPIIEDQPINDKATGKNKTIMIVLIGALVAIIVYFVIQAFTAVSIFNLFGKYSDDVNGEAKNIFERFFDLFDKALTSQEEQFENVGNLINDVQDQMNFDDDIGSQISKTAFNTMLQIYSGSNNGLTLKELLDQVITINKTKEQKIIVKYNELETQDTEEIKNAKIKLDDSDNFEVEFDYDENGYINKVTIEKVIDKFEISSFNSGLEIHAGSSNGMIVTNVLDRIITSNKTEDRKITVKYLQTETQNEEEIRNIKRNFGTFDNCEIIFEYDEDGFINKAIIEKI